MVVLYLLLTWLGGLAVVQRLWPRLPVLARLAGAFAAGTVLTAWVAFAAAWAAHGLGSDDATGVGVWVATAVNAALVVAGQRGLRPAALRMRWPELLGLAVVLGVAVWVMRARLSGDPLAVSLNTWGDTSLHMGIARSFSEGANFPPELPIFAGEPIRYHFGFDFYVGTLERAGLPIGLAFNVPGAIAFAAICVLLVEFGRLLWRSSAIGVIAAVLFATNSSLAFLRYLEAEGADGLRPGTLWDHVGYDGGGPYNGDEISIFMTLNPYLTQTHLMVALVVVLFAVLVLLTELLADRREDGPLAGRTAAIGLGLGVGGAFWFNGIVVVVALGLAGALCLLHRALRRSLPFLVTGAVVAFPQLVWLNGGFGTGGSVSFHLGYLVEDFHPVDPRSWWDFARYWWLNLGVALPLLIAGAVLCRPRERRVLVAVMSVFVLGNVVAFGRELGGHNHKVFNLWELLVNLFVAYAFVRFVTWLWSLARPVAVVAAALAGTLLLASGVLDYLTLKNDPRYEVVGDRAAALEWIRDETAPDAVFLTAFGEVYTTPTLAGRKVYLAGFRPWAEIMGYDHRPREQRIAAVYGAADSAAACRALAGSGVDYVEVGPAELGTAAFDANPGLFPGDFVEAYRDEVYAFYDVARSCSEPIDPPTGTRLSR
ncbi:hypothetical protein [Sporichthya polymorpha]|uniref:hypothetical protein n=1 Tax=Sporichthya polymorpha TaxID=35751 RepID=UPI000373927C|nr:hypothetical protein [Sporichthya polymorpha]